MPINTTIKKCSFRGCTRASAARGYCQTHYTQWRKGKELTPIHERGNVAICKGPGCDRLARAKGLCASHYAQKIQGKKLTRIKARDSAPSGPKLARLPLLERLDASTRRVSATGCLEWVRATNASGSGVLNIDGRTTVVNNVAYDLFFDTSIGSKRVLKACDNLTCIEPGHMYVKGLTEGWELLDEPYYTAREVKEPEFPGWRLVRSINGLDVSRSAVLVDDDVMRAKRAFFGSIDEQRPTEAEWRVWLKYLTLQRMGGEIEVATHPLR